jgi:hypothetical protein
MYGSFGRPKWRGGGPRSKRAPARTSAIRWGALTARQRDWADAAKHCLPFEAARHGMTLIGVCIALSAPATASAASNGASAEPDVVHTR